VRGLRQTLGASIRALVFLAVLVSVPGVLIAKSRTVEIPENARAKHYGSGWECNRGYRAAGKRCVAVKAPANAYLNSFGDRWKFKRGYREVDAACAAVKVPANGYLADPFYELGWKCGRGYRPVEHACVAVKVPANGFFVDLSYGSGWECERGFRAIKDTCVLVKMPKNAHLNHSGNDWECDRPHKKRQLACVLPRRDRMTVRKTSAIGDEYAVSLSSTEDTAAKTGNPFTRRFQSHPERMSVTIANVMPVSSRWSITSDASPAIPGLHHQPRQSALRSYP
jgi:hypothetical protein